MRSSIIVFLGAGCGGVLRHLVNMAAASRFGASFPWGVLMINVSGSFVMGLAAGYFAFRQSEAWSQSLRLFLTTGLLGGYTTFSAFSLDAALLIQRNEFRNAALYVAASVGLSIAGLFLGLAAMRSTT